MRRSFSRSRARLRNVERAFLIVAKTIIVLYGVFILAHWLSERDVFKIRRIEVIGNRVVDEKSVTRIAAEPFPTTLVYKWVNTDNALLYPSSAVRNSVSKLSGWIKDVDVSAMRKGVRITITENEPAFHWCPRKEDVARNIAPEACWYADKEGRVFVTSPEFDGYPFVRIIGYTQGTTTSMGTYIMEPAEFARVAALAAALRNEGYMIRAIVHLGDRDYRITSDRPWDILWESDTDIEQTIKSLGFAADTIAKEGNRDKEVEEIDLRFGGKIFFR
jgi:hypothetical protein